MIWALPTLTSLWTVTIQCVLIIFSACLVLLIAKILDTGVEHRVQIHKRFPMVYNAAILFSPNKWYSKPKYKGWFVHATFTSWCIVHFSAARFADKNASCRIERFIHVMVKLAQTGASMIYYLPLSSAVGKILVHERCKSFTATPTCSSPYIAVSHNLIVVSP